jgi:hypothetical protein
VTSYITQRMKERKKALDKADYTKRRHVTVVTLLDGAETEERGQLYSA